MRGPLLKIIKTSNTNRTVILEALSDTFTKIMLSVFAYFLKTESAHLRVPMHTHSWTQVMAYFLKLVMTLLKACSQAYILITLIPEINSFMIRTRLSVMTEDLNLQ